MTRRKGYAEMEHEREMRYQHHRKVVRRCEAAAVIVAFCGVAAVFYYALWMWANGYIGG